MFCLSPGSLFFLNAYTESATTLTTIAASLLLRRKKYFLAAVVAGIASCVSPVGALFGVALFVAVLYNKLGIVKAIALGIVSEIGALSYALFLYIRFHNPLQNIAAESYWQRHTVFPFSAIWRNILFLFTRKVTFAPVPLPQSNHNMFTVWIIDDFVGVVALVVLGVVALKLLRKKLPQNMPVDWLVFFALSAVLINSSDITVIYNIPSTEAVARLLGSVFPFYPLAYIAFHRLKIIFPILLSVGAALAVIAQIFEILDFWMT